MLNGKKGFTLIELLVVIGIIAILAGIVLVAINPSRQYASARNAERSSEVSQILSAIQQFATQNNGDLPSGITTTVANASTLADDLVSTDLVSTYIPEIPTDPQGGQYTVVQDANGRVTVSAPDAELSQTISVTQ